MAVPFKAQYTAASTTTETDFAAPSDTDSIVNIVVWGPTNWGEQVEFTLYAKRDPAQAAVVRKRQVLSGPVPFDLATGAALMDGWRVSHKKLVGSGSPTVSIEIAGVQ